MKLAHLTDEELFEISLMKTRKGTATSEARRAQQILYTRNITQTVTTYRGKVNFNFCPYCGADMRGEQDE